MFFISSLKKVTREKKVKDKIEKIKEEKVMADMEEMVCFLEERLDKHDNNRREVQSELEGICSEIAGDADLLEEKVGGEIRADYDKKEEEILSLIEKLDESEEGALGDFIKKAKDELSKEWKYEIQNNKTVKNFAGSYEFVISSVVLERKPDFGDTESIVMQLREHLDKIHESMIAAQDKLTEICNKRRKEGTELETRINGKLEELVKQEDARIQSVVKVTKENIGNENPEEVKELIKKAKITLLGSRKYSLKKEDLWDVINVEVKMEPELNFVHFEERKPLNFIVSFKKEWAVSLSFTFFSEVDANVLAEFGLAFEAEVKIWEKSHEEDTSRTLTKKFTPEGSEHICLNNLFNANTTYRLRMKIVYQGMSTQWSDEAEFTTPEFEECCAWKECPDGVEVKRRYSINEKNFRITTNVSGQWCTAIGNTLIPRYKVVSWSAKILSSRRNDGANIYVGVAPFDIGQNEWDNYSKCGWYFHCYESRLYSGPPRNHKGKQYGPRKRNGQYVRTGDSVGVVMDTAKGELSFILDGVNLGVAYEGIPLDKPLVPCVLLWWKGDSIELVI